MDSKTKKYTVHKHMDSGSGCQGSSYLWDEEENTGSRGIDALDVLGELPEGSIIEVTVSARVVERAPDPVGCQNPFGEHKYKRCENEPL